MTRFFTQTALLVLTALTSCGQNPKFTLTGQVTDNFEKKPIHGTTIKLVGSDNSTIEIKTDSLGKYFFDSQFIKANTSYMVSASALDVINKKTYRGYLGNPKWKFSTKDSTTSTNFVQDFTLAPILQCLVGVIPAVRFTKNSSVLENNSKDSLDYLVKIMKENPNITIGVEGHSSYDEINPDTVAIYRIVNVINYLTSKGIVKERMQGTLYGNRKPFVDMNGNAMTQEQINKIAKTKEEKEKLMQLNRRVSFTILRRDFPTN